MRTLSIGLVVASLLTSSAAFAGPPCRTDVGGLCGSDYDGWMEQWRRSNPGHRIMPVSPGGYGLNPNGSRFYTDGNGGVVGGQGYGYGRGGVVGSRVITIPGQTVTNTRPVQIGTGYRCTIRNGAGQIISQYEGPCPH